MPAEEHLDIRCEERGRTTVVRLQGELDIATGPALEHLLESVEGEIVVDLRDVTFVDSAGLQMLLRHRRRPLAVIPGGPHVRRVFDLTDADRLLRMVDAA
jgi:anti-anti-sigma factor